MNSETQDLLRRLEQATSPADIDAGTLDEETAVLRESWLVLGQMLNETEHPRLRLPAAPTKRVRSRRFRFGWILTCATVLWAVIFSGWYFAANRGMVRGPADSVAEKNTGSDMTSHSSPENEIAPAVGSESVAISQSAVELAWDDAFDDQLARTGFAIWQVRGAAPHRDQAWVYLFNELQLISNDLEGGSL